MNFAAVAVLAVLATALPLAVALPPQDPRPDPATLHRAKQLSLTTEHHTRLQQVLGEWDVAVSTTPPGGESRDDRGKLAAASILGGRYMVLNFTLELQDAKVDAVLILGFDTLRQVYTASWRDSLSTWSVDCTGAPSPTAPDVLTMVGTVADAQDATGRPLRLVLELGKPKAVTMRTFETVAGKEIEVQVLRCTKK